MLIQYMQGGTFHMHNYYYPAAVTWPISRCPHEDFEKNRLCFLAVILS